MGHARGERQPQWQHLLDLLAPVHDEARALARRLAPSLADGEVAPVVEHVTGNVCMAAANAFVEIRIDTQSGTDEEIAAQIRSQLAAAGMRRPT